MIVGDELPIVNFQRVITDLGRNAQDVIRIALGKTNVACLDVAELSMSEPEPLGYLSKSGAGV